MCQLTIITDYKSLLCILLPDQIRILNADIKMVTETQEDVSHSGKETIVGRGFINLKKKGAKSSLHYFAVGDYNMANGTSRALQLLR